MNTLARRPGAATLRFLAPPRALTKQLNHGCLRHFASCSSYIEESIDVRVGGTRTINLSVSRPTTPNRSIFHDILVWFPRGPPVTRPLSSQALVKSAAGIPRDLWPSATIITVHYRASARHCFPTPIHHAALAFDHILSHNIGGNGLRGTKHRIHLTGSGIGGALATTLALTKPNAIHAAGVVEPVVDWVGVDEIAYLSGDITRVSSMTKKQRADLLLQAPAAHEMIRARSRLFRTLSAYFDPFASPTLFLRAPGRDTPLTKSAAFDPEVDMADYTPESDSDDSFGPYDDDIRHQVNNDGTPSGTLGRSGDMSGKDDIELDLLPRRRKVVRRWPPIGRPEDVLLPYTRIFLQEPNENGESHRESHVALMRAQGTEFVDLLRRACFFGRQRGLAEARASLSYFSRSADNPVDEVEPGLVEAVTWLKKLSEDESET